MKRVALFLIFFFVLAQGAYWGLTRGLTGANDLGEAFCVFNAGKNFARLGLLDLKFLQDDATSPEASAHPYSYTHQPMFPVYISYLWQRLGAHSFEIQSLLSIPILFLGFVLMFLFLRRRTSENFALAAVAIALFDPLGTMTWGTHLFRVYSWPLLWGCFLFKEDWKQSTKQQAFFATFLFLIFYFEWSFAGYVFLALLIDEGLKNRAFPGRALWFGGICAASAIGLRILIVGNAIGWDIFFTDIRLTLSNRLTGKPSWAEIQKFYEDNHLSLWGFHAILSLDFVLDSLVLFYDRVRDNLGYGTLELNFAVLILPFVQKFSDSVNKILIIHRALFLSAFILLLFSPLYVHHAYIHPFFPLFVFPLTFGKAVLIWQLLEIFQKHTRKVVLASVASLSILCVFQISRQTWVSIPSQETLKITKGKSILTNFHGWYASYLTGNWGATSWGRVSEGSNYFHKHYVLERDKKSTELDQYDFPDYVLCLQVKQVNPCTVDGDFFATYPLVQSGKSFALFDVSSRKGFRPLQREGRWVVADREWAETRNLNLIEPSVTEHPLGKDGTEAHKILDGDPKSEWILDLPSPRKMPWGTLDPTLEMTANFQEDTLPINVLAVLSSAEHPEEIFQSARVFGSRDRSTWEQVSFLVRPSIPHSSQWTTWEFENEIPYRHYKIRFSPMQGQATIRIADIKFVHSKPKSKRLNSAG